MATTLIPVLVVIGAPGDRPMGLLRRGNAARARERRRAANATFVVETPLGWFVACLVLRVIFFPVYVVSRKPTIDGHQHRAREGAVLVRGGGEGSVAHGVAVPGRV